MRRLIAALAVLAASLVVDIVPAGAITNGQPDGDNHPYVGLAVFDVINPATQQQVPSHRCSASLLSPTVVLTAAHCTTGTVAARVWFDEDVSTNPEYPFSGATSYDGDPETNPAFCTIRRGRRVRRPPSCGARRHAEEQVRGRLRWLRSAVPAPDPR